MKHRPVIFWICLLLAWLPWFQHVSLEWKFNPQYGYGWAIPWLTLFIITMRWGTRPPMEKPWNLTPRLLPGPFFLWLAIRIIGETNPDWRMLGWVAGALAGALGFLLLGAWGGGRFARWFLFPLLFPLLATPWPTGIEAPLTQGLMRFVTLVTVEIAQWIGVPAVAEGNLILTGKGWLGVDEACSGVRSFQSSLMAAVFLGELYMLSIRPRLYLVAGSVFIALLLNILRAEWLLLLAHRQGLEEIRHWHDPAGWTIFAILFVLLFACAHLLGRHSKTAFTNPPLPPRFPKLAWSLPLLVIGTQILALFWFRNAPEPAVVAWELSLPQDAPNFSVSEPEENIRRLLRYDEGKAFTWIGKEGELWQAYYFRWDGRKTPVLLSRTHTPEVCLPATGMVYEGSRGFIVPASNAPRFAHSVFHQGVTEVHVFHGLDETTPLPETFAENPWSWKSRLYLAWKGWRHRGAQLLTLAVSDAPPDVPASAMREIGDLFE